MKSKIWFFLFLLAYVLSRSVGATETCSQWGTEPQENGFKELSFVGSANWGYSLMPLYDEPLVSTPATWTEIDEGSEFGVIFANPATLCGARFYSYANGYGWNHITRYEVLGLRQPGGTWEIVVPERSATYPKGLPGWESVTFNQDAYYGIKINPKGIYYCCAPRVGELQFRTFPSNATLSGQYDTVIITPSINAVSLPDSGANSYVVQNNVWGGGSQTMTVEKASGNFSVKATSHNAALNGAPAAYPSVFKGCHWGNCTDNSGMPKKVASILHANSSWVTVQPALGIYNAAYDLWLNQSPTTQGKPDGAELMIWLSYKPGIQPTGVKIAQDVVIAGTKWEIWYGSGSPSTISYVRSVATTAVSNLDLKAFLVDSKNRGYIQSNWYLMDVEAGFEVWQNGVGLGSRTFNVLVE